jgi:hypothetical protein
MASLWARSARLLWHALRSLPSPSTKHWRRELGQHDDLVLPYKGINLQHSFGQVKRATIVGGLLALETFLNSVDGRNRFSRNHSRSFDAIKARSRGTLGSLGALASRSLRIFRKAKRATG